MSTFAGRVARKAVETDVSAVRGLSALRRAAVVVAVLLVGNSVVGLDAAVNAATAAFLVGMLDKGRSPRATWEVMGLSTLFFGFITALAGALSWSVWAVLAMLVMLAFSAGVSIVIDQRAPQILLFAALLTASHLVSPIEIHDLPASVALVLFAGLLQTLLALLAAPVVGDSPERRELASTMRAIARNCAQISNEAVGAARDGAQAAAIQAGRSDDLIKRGDIATEDRERYALLLADLDLIRLEARAYSARIYLGIPVPRTADTVETFSRAGKILTVAATAIEHRKGERHIKQLHELVDEWSAEPQEQTSRTAAAVRTSVFSLPMHVEDVLHKRRVHRQLKVNAKPLSERIKASVAPDSASLKYGYRMAAAAFIGEIISIMFHLPQGAWVAVTAMMMLRPDGTPAPPRILMRAIGTVFAVGLILGILLITRDSQALVIAFIAVVLFLTYAIAAVNYAAQTALTALTILLLLSLTYPEPEQLALTRLFDVFLGCVIGTAFAFAMPIWKRGQLRGNIADYAASAAGWFADLAKAAELPPGERAQQLAVTRASGRRTRDLREKTSATLRTTLLEPPDARVDVGTLGIVLSWIRRSSDAGIAAEAILRHDIVAGPGARELAAQASSDLSRAAEVLRAYGPEDAPANVMIAMPLARQTIDEQAADRTTAVLARAEISAASALRSTYRVRSADV